MNTTTNRKNDRAFQVARAEFWTNCEKQYLAEGNQKQADYCWLQALNHKNNIDDIDARQPIQY